MTLARWRRTAVAVVLGSGVALGAGAASELLDPGQDEILVIGPGEEIAQIVTVDLSGELTGVRLPVSCARGTFHLEIQGVTDGLPDGRVLASEDLTEAPPDPASTFRTLPLTGRPFVQEGEFIALLLGTSGTCTIHRDAPGDSYPFGTGLFRPEGSESWIYLGGEALPFQTLMRRSENTVVVGVNLDGNEAGEDEERPEGGYVAARCFVQTLGQ